jgi:hypothetical protein
MKLHRRVGAPAMGSEGGMTGMILGAKYTRERRNHAIFTLARVP